MEQLSNNTNNQQSQIQQNPINKSPQTEEKKIKAITFDEIPGLRYYRGIINQEQEKKIIKEILNQEWNTQLKRRTQHYGYRYDYTIKNIEESMYLGELPSYAQAICKQLIDFNIIKVMPDQMIVNEYTPGQGISPHIDSIKAFGDTIFTISLGSQCLMNFSLDTYNQDVLLERRSLAILQSDSRYKFKHSIAARKTDKYQGDVLHRSTRYSLTFRKTVFEKSNQ